MKFTCPRERLFAALQAVSSVVPTHRIKDIYESVHVTASARGIRVYGTDGEVSMAYDVPAADDVDVAEAGTLLAPAKRFTAILAELPEGPVTVAWTSGSCTVKSSGGVFRIAAGNPDDFPPEEAHEGGARIVVPGAVLRELVQRTAFAAAKEKMRYALHGILLIASPDGIQAVATDGRRLAHAVAPAGARAEVEARAIVPTRALTHLVRAAKDESEDVSLSLSGNHVSVEAANVLVRASLVEGTFPNFEEVIPVNCERRARLDRERFLAGLRRAAVLFASGAGSTGPTVRLRFEEGADLSIRAAVVDVGEAEVTVPCTYEGKADDVGYNAGFLIEALGAVSAPEVTFEFNSKQGPGRLSDGDRFTYVVMPVTLE